MRKIANLTSQLAGFQRAWQGPTSANIEVTNLCNIDCIMCRRTGWGKGRDVGNMKLQQFAHVLEEIPTLRSGTLTGIGEPLINKDLLPMLRASKERGVDVTFVTNGTLLDRQGSNVLLEMRELASQIIVSLDSPNAEEFEKIRVRANYGQVINGIRSLTGAENGGSGLAPIRVNMVVMDSTIGRMTEMVELCADLEVDIVTFTPIMEYRPDVDLWRDQHVKAGLKFVEEKASASEAGVKLGVAVSFDGPDPSRYVRFKGCSAPWTSIAITFDGYVCPCCMLNDSDEIHFGNIFAEPFSEIWNGSGYREFRSKFGPGKVPCECIDVECHVAASIVR